MDHSNTLTVQITNAYACSKDCSLFDQKDAELEKLYVELESERAAKADLDWEHEELQEKYKRTQNATATYKHMQFERSTEKRPPDETQNDPGNDEDSPPKKISSSKRKRGAQPGHKGHGRKIPQSLPVDIRRWLKFLKKNVFARSAARNLKR